MPLRKTNRHTAAVAEKVPQLPPAPPSPKTMPKTKMNRSMQALFAFLLLMPQIAYFIVWGVPYESLSLWFGELANRDAWVRWITDPDFVKVALALSFERACYTFVWCFPSKFWKVAHSEPMKAVADNPVDIIVRTMFYPSKVLQCGSMLWFYLAKAPPVTSVFDISAYAYLCAIQLIACGQILNAGIYRAIGKAGVYYGFKYGIDVPWCNSFPFNVCTAHPQYLGATMTSFGAVILLSTPEHYVNGTMGIACVQALLYLYMAIIESY